MKVAAFVGPIHPLKEVLFCILLLTVCISDLRTRRIPNGLVAGILFLGLLSSVMQPSPLTTMASALVACAVGFLIWLPFYVFKMIGAGDVKFFAAASTWIGSIGSVRAALWSAVFGLVLALVYSVRQRRDLAQRQRLPYGVAMAAGLASAAWLPTVL